MNRTKGTTSNHDEEGIFTLSPDERIDILANIILDIVDDEMGIEG